ncbi:MAG: hypothetical protein DRP45_11440 [Candidatus Zixiibacteriota bacterium]|nr:MAG: hypothetical protein DRP45_11440 [candidate division Zixibacteria bacterium]
MANLPRSHGVDYTAVKNPSGIPIFLPWYPTTSGWGRTLNAHETVRFSGNLFEAIVGRPDLRQQLEADARSGRVALAACGEPDTVYTAIEDQADSGFRTWGCVEEYE